MLACLTSDFSFSLGAKMYVFGVFVLCVFWLVCNTGFPRTGCEEQSALKLTEICLLLKLDFFGLVCF